MNPLEIKEVTVAELKRMKDANEDFQLIDVREADEYAFCNIGGQHIPLGSIPSSMDLISEDKMVIMQCRSGSRSGKAIQFLQSQHPYENLYNLKGGILAWADEIDPTIPKY